MELTKEQYRLLKFIKRKKVIKRDDIPERKSSSLSKLIECNFVDSYGVGHSGIDCEYYEIAINENGKMYIETRKRSDSRFWFPVIVSIIAVIVSAFSLYKSSQPIYISIDTTNMTATTTSDATEK